MNHRFRVYISTVLLTFAFATLSSFCWAAASSEVEPSNSGTTIQGGLVADGDTDNSLWRRTRYGWEKAYWLRSRREEHRSDWNWRHLHPGLFAILQLCAITTCAVLGWDHPSNGARRPDANLV